MLVTARGLWHRSAVRTFFCAALLCTNLMTANAMAKTVTVTGVAKIEGDVAAARDLAIRNGQRVAIEEVLGSYIETHFTAEQRETAKDDASHFSSDVRDKIYAKSVGFIDSQ